jgi:hypothetical protein
MQVPDNGERFITLLTADIFKFHRQIFTYGYMIV